MVQVFKKDLKERYKVIIVGFYNIPHIKEKCESYLLKIIACLKQKFKEHDVVIAGDFNLAPAEMKSLTNKMGLSDIHISD